MRQSRQWVRTVVRRARILIMLALALGVAACIPGPNGGGWGVGSYQGDTSTRAIHDRGGLVIATVPEVQPVMQALAHVWATEHPDIPLAFSVSTAIISAQSTNTAIATDLLITDLDQAQYETSSQGAIPEPGEVFAASTLDFAMPASNPAGITSLQQVARINLHLINVGWSSGISWYTLRSLQRMMRNPAFAPAQLPCGSTYSNCVYANVAVTAADGLAAARMLVGQTHYQGAFVYNTNVLEVERERGAGALTTIAVPTSLAPPNPVWCAIGGLAAANLAHARLFQQFLLSPPAQAVLANYGYLPPSSTSGAPDVTP